jgi:hypothetical protein
MKLYEEEEAAELAPEAAPPTAPEVTGRTDANGVPISNWRYFWRGENWHRNRDVERGNAQPNTVETGTTQGNTARNGDSMGQAEALEMARWSYFARTRR